MRGLSWPVSICDLDAAVRGDADPAEPPDAHVGYLLRGPVRVGRTGPVPDPVVAVGRDHMRTIAIHRQPGLESPGMTSELYHAPARRAKCVPVPAAHTIMGRSFGSSARDGPATAFTLATVSIGEDPGRRWCRRRLHRWSLRWNAIRGLPSAIERERRRADVAVVVAAARDPMPRPPIGLVQVHDDRRLRSKRPLGAESGDRDVAAACGDRQRAARVDRDGTGCGPVGAGTSDVLDTR